MKCTRHVPDIYTKSLNPPAPVTVFLLLHVCFAPDQKLCRSWPGVDPGIVTRFSLRKDALFVRLPRSTKAKITFIHQMSPRSLQPIPPAVRANTPVLFVCLFV